MDTLARLTFLAGSSPAPVYRASVGGAQARLDISGDYEEHDVPITDGRLVDERFSLDTHGFELIEQATAATDLFDDEQRTGLYEAECREIVVMATGAVRVHCFDHTLRSSDSVRRDEKKIREPTSVIHNDYTPCSAPQRVLDLMGEDAAALLDRPFAIVNVWRPLRLVRSYPLAVCDARTLEPTDLVAAERKARDRIGELYMARFERAQRWYYFPDMLESEVLLIKTFDSREDGRARWCIHTAIPDEGADATIPSRESIETRVFAFF